MRLYSSVALLGIMLFALLQTTGPGGCTLGTVDPNKALKVQVSLVEKGEISAKLKIMATNLGESKLSLYFKTSQRFELLTVEKESRRILWRWSFGQEIKEGSGLEEIKPGEALTYEAEMPYAGLPPTKYEIVAFIILQPHPVKSLAPVDLDLTDKKVGSNSKHIVGEVGIDDTTNPATIYIQTLNGVKYILRDFPEVFNAADKFPVEVWLSGDDPPFHIDDYVWVMAPLPENAQLFLSNNVLYAKSGGIMGLQSGLKIYSDGSFMAYCCRANEQVKTGYSGDFEALLQFLTAQKITELHDQYGKPGKVADGFNEYMSVRNLKYSKQVSVYQDPDDPPPNNFRKVVERLSELVKINGF